MRRYFELVSCCPLKKPIAALPRQEVRALLPEWLHVQDAVKSSPQDLSPDLVSKYWVPDGEWSMPQGPLKSTASIEQWTRKHGEIMARSLHHVAPSTSVSFIGDEAQLSYVVLGRVSTRAQEGSPSQVRTPTLRAQVTARKTANGWRLSKLAMTPYLD